MLFFFLSPTFYNMQVWFPMNWTPIVQKISESPCFKFFNKCISTVDRTHIHVFSSTEDHAIMCNRKGYLSQNCLFVCDFDFFVYVLCGWDGWVADTALWQDAVMNNILVPPNWYLLGDMGFLLCDALLVSYHGVDYHLREWCEGAHG